MGYTNKKIKHVRKPESMDSYKQVLLVFYFRYNFHTLQIHEFLFCSSTNVTGFSTYLQILEDEVMQFM